MKQINDIDLLSVIGIPDEIASMDWLTGEYPELNSNKPRESYVVSTYCRVSHENAYFYNRVNYFLMVFVIEDGSPKLVQFNTPSYEMLSQMDMDELVQYDSEYASEQEMALEALRLRSQGLLVNSKLEAIDDNMVIVSSDVVKEGADLCGGIEDFPILGAYTNYSYPKSIRGKLSNNSIVKVDFVEYMRNVLPNEWYSTWKQDSLIAGALCVKMVGWYRTISPVSVAGGYDLTPGTQMYVAGTATQATDNAISIVYEFGMANSNYCLFFPEYARGVKGEAGPQAGGQLKQWGSQYLAEQGKNYEEILNYYSGSDFSTGNVVIFDISSY